MMRVVALLAVLLAAGCGGGADMERISVHSELLDRTIEQGVYDPGEPGRPLLVLLHGRGSDPEDVWTLGLQDELERIAIGGISMGGFGALDLARLHPNRFCAVGGHSPALWRTGGETPLGAFDDAEDFGRHDLFGGPYAGRAPVWIDVGRDDPFHDAANAYAELLRRHGREVTLRISPGGHDREYWKRHLRAYLGFYAGALADC